VSVKLHAPAVLPSGKEPPVPIGQKAEWTVWRNGSRVFIATETRSDDNVLDILSSQLQGLGSFLLKLEEPTFFFPRIFLCEYQLLINICVMYFCFAGLHKESPVGISL
jgi:hypothetical protein